MTNYIFIGTTKHCCMLNTPAIALVVLEIFSHYEHRADIDTRGVVNLVPRGMVGRIYEGDYKTLLHTKYRSSRPCSFRDFFNFSQCTRGKQKVRGLS